MGKTWFSVLTALILIGLSVTWFSVRQLTQGPDVAGPRGEHTWKVTMRATGTLAAPNQTVTTLEAPDFRRQHIFEEAFSSPELTPRMVRKKPERREVVWRRSGLAATPQVQLSYSFRCVTAVRRPTRAMVRMTHAFDGAPSLESSTRPSPKIESDHKEIARQAHELSTEDSLAEEDVRTFFEFVDQMANEPEFKARSAIDCLHNGAGTAADKSRLLIALCRNKGIPARLVSGVILLDGSEQRLHYWTEAWVEGHWQPMCPTFHHYGNRQFPQNYLVLHIGDEDIVRSRGTTFQVAFNIQAQALHDAHSRDPDSAPTTMRLFWRYVSLYSLRPAEQHLVRFLLLLPLAALIVSFYRTVIGITTYGTFGPALLGLAFLDLKGLPWGLLIFVLTVLAGWGMRHLLDRFHLLLVPRTSVLLTLIILFLILVIMVASHYGISGTQYISLFPLVILTHMVERFWTLESEDGTVASFKTLLGTLLVAVTVSLALGPDAVTSWMLHYPETLGAVLACQFLLGRYTGYRLTELYRFADLLQEETLRGGQS
jgi:hypothetical protein